MILRSVDRIMNDQQAAYARSIVAKLTRDDLEDKYLRIQEENAILKRHARKQEEKIKRIGTKLMRLVEDRKKHTQYQYAGKRTSRDVTLEETIETQQDTIRKLTKENDILKQRVLVSQQQLQTQGKRHTPYNHIPSRINTGMSRRQEDDKYSTGLRTKDAPKLSRSSSAKSSGSPLPRYGHSLLEEAREENHQMRNTIVQLQEHIAFMEGRVESMQEELRLKSADNEENLLHMKKQMNVSQKTTLTENIELIRLQRDMKEKNNELTVIKARYHELQENYERFEVNYDKVLHEMNTLKSRLSEEENKSLKLKTEMKHGRNHQFTISELKQNILDLEREVEILRETNDRLTNSALSNDSESKWRQLERKLRMQIAQLESALKHDARNQNDVLDRITNERGLSSRLQNEQRHAQEEASKLRAENRDLRDRVRLLSSLDDAIDVGELEEALGIIRQRRHAEEGRKRPGFLENVDDEKDPEMALSELMIQHAETIQELEKTREMLLMQHKINKDYQVEVESTSFKMEDMKREYEEKLENFARLLDVRAAKIKKLERQLHDVAYGTKQYKYIPEEDEEEEMESAMDVTRLERGENLMEINVTKVVWSPDALHAMQDREPSTFATFAFYDYELVSTPIIKSTSPRFDFTSQYTVKIDDIFLHHLQKASMVVEIHQAFGTEFKTVAGCKIRFNQLLDTRQGKLHGSATLIGMKNGLNYGNLDFWIRLRVPMTQAIRLYKERTKALGYLSANSAVTQKQISHEEEAVKHDNNNQLIVHIINCNHVSARREGCQPDIFCVYKFFDFADHDTNIVPSSNSPYFDERQSYPVQMTADLNIYLKSEKLDIYVFDDGDPDVTSYLGKATIDLIPLVHNKIIRAPFQLVNSEGETNGTIEISLRWQLEYSQPPDIMKIQHTLEEREEMIPEKLSSPTAPSVVKKSTMKAAPRAASTPKPNKPDKKETPSQPEEESTITEVKPTPKQRNMTSSIKSQPQKDQEEEIVKKNDDIQKLLSTETEDNQEIKSTSPAHKEEDEFDQETDDDESDIPEDIPEVLPEEVVETDSDSQLVLASSPHATQRQSKQQDQVRVTVNHLALHPESSAFKNKEVQNIFVEYDFLGGTHETPDALPKPKAANDEISYNYSKVLHVDSATHEDQRNILLHMLLKKGGFTSKISFNVVAEPPVEDEDSECVEIGVSQVDLLDILQRGQDITDTDVDITDQSSGELIGRLNVSLEALNTLEVLRDECKGMENDN